MSLDTFSQNTFTGKLNQGQGHDGSVFDEVSSNLTRDFFTQNPVNINVSKSASPNLAFVPASRYNCDVKRLYVNVCVTFHQD